MSPEERALYSTTLYLVGDEVEISGTGIYGEVTGIRIEAGSEDQYQVFYIDNSGNPQERWWKASALDPAPTSEANANVLPFPTWDERARAISEARHATKH